MTVAELTKKLHNMPQDKDVNIPVWDVICVDEYNCDHATPQTVEHNEMTDEVWIR